MPSVSGSGCFPLSSLQLPSPSRWSAGLSGAPDPSSLRVRELQTLNAGFLGACPATHQVASRSELGASGFPWGRRKEPAGCLTLQAEAAQPFPAEQRGRSCTAVSCALNRSGVPQPGHRPHPGTLSLALRSQLPSLLPPPGLTLDPEREPHFCPPHTWPRDRKSWRRSH